MAGFDLGKQYGPLPLGAWIIVVAGGLGIAWYTKQSANGTPVTDTSAIPTDQQAVGDGSVGGWTQTTPTTSTTSPTTTAPTTNEEWGQQAINWLISQNYDPTLADSAIRAYLSGVSPSVTQNVLIGLALVHLGSPPVPLPVPDGSGTPPAKTPIPTTPPKSTPGTTNPKPTPKPTPKPAPKPKYKAKYTVKKGDNLWNIAKHYYGNGALYGKIYAENKKGHRRLDGSVGMISNPSLIYPGWVLIIPN